MFQVEKNRTEIKLGYLNAMMACRYNSEDNLCIMKIIKAAGDFAKDCIRNIKISNMAEMPIYEKTLQNIAVVSVYNAMIKHKNTCVEIEKCLEDMNYLKTLTDAIGNYTNDLLMKSIIECICNEILAEDSIFMMSIKKYDDLRLIYERYIREAP